MIFEHNTLQDWINDDKCHTYPTGGKADFGSMYNNLKTNSEIISLLKNQNVGTQLNTTKGLMTSHDDKHVDRVIEIATSLVKKQKVELSPFEVYILLCSITLHDIAMIQGRENHENQIFEVLHDIELDLKNDVPTYIAVRKIASAHTGRDESGNPRDTIADLPLQEQLLYGKIRTRLLAAILRFSDELADDRTRLIPVKKIPTESEIYHKYVSCLEPVIIEYDNYEVEIKYNIPKQDAVKKFGKGNKKVYLVDEIYERALKVFMEYKYCSQYFHHEIRLDRFNFLIEFYDKSTLPYKISFTLSDKGYPTGIKNIFRYCDDLVDNEGNRIDGLYTKRLIKEGG